MQGGYLHRGSHHRILVILVLSFFHVNVVLTLVADAFAVGLVVTGSEGIQTYWTCKRLTKDY
jgi:predicted histidine transporter YuiF (NhaC family)